MTKAGVDVIAYHGWGFDASCWDPWKKLLGNSFQLRCYEAGYFGRPEKAPVLSDDHMPKIVMAHSFGLHLCPESHFQKADLVVVFSGFLQFHPVAAQYNRRSRLMLNQMMNRLDEDPQKVLKDFYKNTFHPAEPTNLPRGDFKADLLHRDLQELDTHKIGPEVMKKADKMCILHGSKDAIVPRRKGRELYDSFSSKSQYFEINDAGHALPFTHAGQCWQFLEPELTELIS